ncbi:putative bifunctional inhibitor/plant lipid transfer protein/seed storage helical [Helianthus annuus]|nr:putative bifunctional inhibitor/plant lipid transfer protein/seed storage helical [Helianthus annuus]
MANLVLAALTMAAFLAFVFRTAYGGCIEGSPVCFPDGLDNPRGCQIPIQKLNHCQMHLASFDYKLRMAVENPKQQHHLNLCCNQLQEVEKQCQCEAIKKEVEQAQRQLQQGQGGQQQVQQMVKKALMLPNQCNLQCSI